MDIKEIMVAIQKAAETIATPNCTAWLSAVAAIVAVAVAVVIAVLQIKIAKKQNEIIEEQTKISKKQADIAEQQNRISLFKERYSIYSEFQKILNIRQHLKGDWCKARTALICVILAIFGYPLDPSSAQTSMQLSAEALQKLLPQMKKTEYRVGASVFLFSDIEENDVDEFICAWGKFIEELIYSTEINKTTVEKAEVFIEKCDYFDEKYTDKMRKQLNLE